MRCLVLAVVVVAEKCLSLGISVEFLVEGLVSFCGPKQLVAMTRY